MRVNKTSDYTVMSNAHFREKEMSLKTKGLLSLMLSLPDDWDYSIAGLVQLSKDGKDSVISALLELEQFGYLRRTRSFDEKGHFAGYNYDIYEIPQTEKPQTEKPNTEEPKAGKPYTENPYTGKPYTENPPQLNTNKSNTKKLNTKEKKKERKKTSYDEILSSIENDSLRELYYEFIKMRNMIKAPMTDRALKMLITEVNKYEPNSIENQKKMLGKAILKNWKSVYPLKPQERNTKIFRGEQKADDFSDIYENEYIKPLPSEKEVEAFRERIKREYHDLSPDQQEEIVDSFRKGEWE